MEKKQEIKSCFTDASNQADNHYRGELLEVHGLLLILQAVFMANPQVNCFNGVVSENQHLIRLFKTFYSWIHLRPNKNGFMSRGTHNTSFSQLSLVQQLNEQCNQMARTHLLWVFWLGEFIEIEPIFSRRDHLPLDQPSLTKCHCM